MYERHDRYVHISPQGTGPELEGYFPTWESAKEAVQCLDELQTKHWTAVEWEGWFYSAGGVVMEKLS